MICGNDRGEGEDAVFTSMRDFYGTVFAYRTIKLAGR